MYTYNKDCVHFTYLAGTNCQKSALIYANNKGYLWEWNFDLFEHKMIAQLLVKVWDGVCIDRNTYMQTYIVEYLQRKESCIVKYDDITIRWGKGHVCIWSTVCTNKGETVNDDVYLHKVTQIEQVWFLIDTLALLLAL